MANLQIFLVLLAIVAFARAASQNLVAPRITGGAPIDTLRQFPHHVTIEELGSNGWGTGWICAGSILNERWILTSALCVEKSDRLQLHFEKLYSNNTLGSYSAVVNSDAVHIYPTHYDDIALVKLPFRLFFSDLIKPVNIASQPLAQLENKLAVLPGFDEASSKEDATGTSPAQQLNYAMLKIISNTNCKEYYKSGEFDEYLQFCTLDYGSNSNTLCGSDYGSGLLSGWPANSELVGIYSHGMCEYPAIYTNVAKYASWIQSVISNI